jgi:23S rRNA pseudouridine1911/1915/1917 synthase
MNKVWSGRVVKHSPETVSFGTEENVALLEQYYPPLVAIADEEDEGKTVRDVLVRHFQVSSKLLAQARTTDYGLTINEERVYISAPVVKGEVVRLRMERETSEFIEPEPMSLSIIFEDESLLVINKPPHVIVHPTHGHYSGTLANGVVHYWQQKNEHYRFRPIHRLDEETSGIVVIAKNAYIHQQLSEFMQEGDMDKRYLAIVHGHVQKESFDIEAPIERHPDTPHLRTVRHDGQYAKTGVRCLEQLNLPCGERIIPLSFIELKLYTGRTHQIRVHMHAQGHPLIGDKFYYEEHLQDEALFIGMERQALHAYQLTLTHPLTKARLTFTASLPTDMQTIINRTKSSGGV